jgi:hypothetical protein
LASIAGDLRREAGLPSPELNCGPFYFLPNRENGSDMFKASLVIPSKDKAAFFLSYEELLQRRLGKYEHSISVRPQQLVGRLTVEVDILERSGITSLEVLPLHNSRKKGSGKAEGESGLQPVLRSYGMLKVGSWVSRTL